MMANALSTMVWTIKNFDMSPYMPGECIRSPEFNVGSYRFCLQLYPRGYEINQIQTLSFDLYRTDNNPAKEILVSFKSCIVDNTNFSKYELELEGRLQKNIFNPDTLLTAERCLLLPDKDVTIKYEIFSVKEIDEGECFETDQETAKILSDNFSEIFKSGLYADMVITASDEKFQVHKLIIENRCPKLFASLKQNTGNEYSLDRVKPPILQAILEYLYTGTFKISNINTEIFNAFHAYNIFALEHIFKITYSKHFTAITEVPVSQLSFRWTIPKITELPTNQEIEYTGFCDSVNQYNNNIKICLAVIENENDSKRLQLKFKKMENCRIGFMRCKITFFKDRSDEIIKDYEHLFLAVEWIIPLEAPMHGCQLLENDSLDMFLDISLPSSEVNSRMANISSCNIGREGKNNNSLKSNINLLQKDFHHVFKDMKLPDVTFHVGDETHYAHKLFLCGRSPVFARMFENDCLENNEGVINITDIDSKIVSKMLLYIYCGYTDSLNISDAINLYAAADKYELLTLKDRCATFLKGNINANTVGEILVLAEVHQDEMLKTCVYDFITSNLGQILAFINSLEALESRPYILPDVLKSVLKCFFEKIKKLEQPLNNEV